MNSDQNKTKADSNFWYDKNVLITGGAGFIGSWLSRLLCDMGAAVTVLSEKNASESVLFQQYDLSKRTELVEGDIRNWQFVRDLAADGNFDILFHLAAQSQVTVAQEDPRATFEVNIAGTWNLLEAFHQTSPASAFVLASTVSVSGETTDETFDESAPLAGAYPYEVSKACAELIGKSYCRTYNMPVGTLRFSNLYGPGDMNFRRIIPGTVLNVLKNTKPQIRGNGQSVRDYLYIHDAVEALLLLGKYLQSGDVTGQVFQVSSMSCVTTLDLVKIILHLMQQDQLGYEIVHNGSAEISQIKPSSEKIRKQLGWQPRFTLEQGLQETIDWYLKHSNQLVLGEQVK
ncbi:MAG: SDR family NAD(P)-dependent oxidoreductase [Sedimentisphaerales bacterium]|nr:SDR family NAD(P)-dependent oxidoreductase [Sedimentisphaerales bacterium]